MTQFENVNYTTTGEKTMLTIDPQKLTYLLISAPSDAEYDVEIKLDSDGERVLVSRVTGDSYLALVESGYNGAEVGLNVITLPSGSIDFEVLSQVLRL